MNPDAANDPELRELGQRIDRAVTTTTPDLDAAWDALVGRLARDRRRRRTLRTAAAVIVMVLVVGGVGAELSRRSGEQGLGSDIVQVDTDIVDEPLTEPVADATPSSVRGLLALPGCAAWGDLTSWADEAMAEWGVVLEQADWAGVPVSEVLEAAPMPRDSGAACVLTIASSNSASDPGVVAYALQAANGTVVARGVSMPHATNEVPPEIVSAKPYRYHQGQVGSGQQFSGNLEGGVGVGISGVVDARRLVVLDLAAMYPAGGEEYANNTALLARLTFDRLTPPRFGTSNLPTRVPVGYGRCGGLEGIFDVYCNAQGHEVLLNQTSDVTDSPTGAVVERAGFVMRAIPAAAGRQRWRVDQSALVRGVVDAPASVPVDALAEMLGSVPILDPRLQAPASGTGDLRAVATPDWVVAQLQAVGAADVRFTGVSPSDGFVPVSFAVDGRPASLNVYPAIRRYGVPFVEGIMNRPFEMVRVGAVDLVHVTRPAGTSDNLVMSQIFFHCGELEWNLMAMGWPSADARMFATELVASLPCNA